MDDDNEDRLSSLPDSLIHEIFKFMDTKQVIATSLLSKRWNSPWLSNPYLNFISEDILDYLSDSKGCENFVDQVLLSRDHDLQALCLEKYCVASPEKLGEWADHAIARNVQQIKLVLVDISGPTLQLLCANLKCLTLDEVSIFFKAEEEELLLNCPIMETLVLHDCFFGGRIYICSNIKLSAPILKVLKFEGSTSPRNYTIDNLSSIVTAVIDVNIYFGEDDSDSDSDPEDILDNILGGLTNAQSLTLSLDNLLDSKETFVKFVRLQNIWLIVVHFYTCDARYSGVMASNFYYNLKRRITKVGCS